MATKKSNDHQDVFKKEPWELYPDVWKTKSSFFVWLRGGLRRAIWEKYPPKIKFKNEGCTPPPENYTGRAKSGAPCALTGDWTPKSYLEVDHIKGHASLTDWDNVLDFVKHLCSDSSNFQLVDKDNHRIKSYADKKGISFEEALIEKKAIAIIKDKNDKQFFTDRGIKVPSNVTLRRKGIIQILNEELKQDILEESMVLNND